MANVKYLDNNGLLYLLTKLQMEFAAADHTHEAVTEDKSGFMTPEQLKKLNGIEEGATKTTIAQTITETAKGTEAASAKAVYDYVTAALADISGLSAEIVEQLPATGKSSVIYLVKKTSESENNAYDEYMWISEKWELIGSTDIDLTAYIKKTELTAITNEEIDQIITAAGG